jgi:hypothetical protein
MENNIGIYIGVAVVSAVTTYLFLKNKNKTDIVSEKLDSIYEDQIKLKIQNIEEDFITQAIGFYLQEKVFELNLDKNDKEELFKKLGYKEEFSSPVIDWANEFNFMKSHIHERDSFIEAYLIKKDGVGFCKDGEFILNCFERSLLGDARKKVVEIWNKKENKELK